MAVFLDGADAQKAYAAAVADVAADDEKQGADDYKDFVKSTNTMAKALPKIQESVKTKDAQANALLAALKAPSTNFDFAGVVSAQRKALLAFAELITDKDQKSAFTSGVNTVADAYDSYNDTVEQYYQAYLAGQTGGKPTVEQMVAANMDAGWDAFFASDRGKGAIQQAKAGIAQAQGLPDPSMVPDETAKSYIKENNAEAKAGVEAAVTEQVKAGVKAEVQKQVKQGYEENATLTAGKGALIGAMTAIATKLDEVNEKVNGKSSKIKTALLPGLKKFNSQVTEDKIDDLVDGQNDVAKGIRTIAQAVLGTKALRDGVEENLGSDAIKLLKTYKVNPNPLNTKISDFAAFEKQMDTKPGIVNLLAKARGLLVTTKTKGQKTYNAGKAKLASGKAQYAQGLADYAAAPAKLAAGRAQLAEGLQKLMDGRQELADGKEKLGEYEDGEQQVRDGLATLVGTEPDGGLTSILERLDGKGNFDDPNGHLELDEGLNAVEVGRGYQADSGELITKEITGRAVGTAAGIGAGVLAILAGLLSLFRKNKAAGVTALLSAAAGAAAVGVGTSAGMEFSHIAGSTVSSMPWVACGVLAAVAAVHALVHFAGNKTA